MGKVTQVQIGFLVELFPGGQTINAGALREPLQRLPPLGEPLHDGAGHAIARLPRDLLALAPVAKDAPEFELDQAVRSVMRKGSYFSPSVAQRLLQPSEPTAAEKLTERQLEVLTLLAQGKAPKQIGFELGLSSRTVDVHRARIMERLQLHDLASLVRYAVREGLVEL